MEEFLTKKAKNRIWEIPVLAVLLLFASVGISIMGDDLSAGKSGTDIVVDAVLLFLFIFPCARIIIRRIRVRHAVRIAGVLERSSGTSISLSRLQREARIRGSMERILQILLEKNFLQGIRPGFSEGMVYLVSAVREEKALEEMEKTHVMECPFCGAVNTVIRGAPAEITTMPALTSTPSPCLTAGLPAQSAPRLFPPSAPCSPVMAGWLSPVMAALVVHPNLILNISLSLPSILPR